MPLLKRNHCGMHMPEIRLWRQKWAARCDRATEMRLQQRDVDMAHRLGETYFSLYRREEDVLVEGV